MLSSIAFNIHQFMCIYLPYNINKAYSQSGMKLCKHPYHRDHIFAPSNPDVSYNLENNNPDPDIYTHIAINSIERNVCSTVDSTTIAVTEDPSLPPFSLLLMHEEDYRSLFKPENYVSSSQNVMTGYNKIEKIFHDAKEMSNFHNLDIDVISHEIYYDEEYNVKRFRAFGFIIIAPIDIRLTNMILTEQTGFIKNQSNPVLEYTDGSFNNKHMAIKLKQELSDLSHVSKQLKTAIDKISRVFDESIECSDYSNDLKHGFNLLKMINSIRVNRIFDSFYMQSLMRFSNYSIMSMDYYKRTRNAYLNKTNKEMTGSERALDEFQISLKYPASFHMSVEDVKYKKTIIYSACTQILNFILQCSDQIEFLNLETNDKDHISSNLFHAYKHALKTLDNLKYIGSYEFNNEPLIEVERSFSTCVKGYLDAEKLLSSSIENLQSVIKTELFMYKLIDQDYKSVEAIKMVESSESGESGESHKSSEIGEIDYEGLIDESEELFELIKLDKESLADKKKVDLVKNVISLLESEFNMSYKKEDSVGIILNEIAGSI
ncbi:hypothetical protein NEPAR05_0619 [Nematocida parisii]|uniref:Uncharacterized protein n=1 Tax=Nematocida parisii (strain ERTm3) TaxID=935791 RepID=I3EI55_NEMP3|nr:hypothetical protein NEQG_00721 [Nematocida parisii ERTm3]KAI5143686.1 hypothetical protein NEPAR07_0784 [Nematocida parisii]KAI5156489.1 hypothetical protein NEPAR05_0619 [Nematocida parisii]